MRFSSILIPLATLAGLVLATPLEERGTRVTAVDSPKPNYEPGTPKENPSPAAAHVEGTESTFRGVTGPKRGKCKRHYNHPFHNADPNGQLIACTGYGCSGTCNGYTLPTIPGLCWWVQGFNSFYVSGSSAGLTYGLFIGVSCDGVLPVPRAFLLI